MSNYVGGDIKRIISRKNTAVNVKKRNKECLKMFYIKFQNVHFAELCIHRLRSPKYNHNGTLQVQSFDEKMFDCYFPVTGATSS